METLNKFLPTVWSHTTDHVIGDAPDRLCQIAGSGRFRSEQRWLLVVLTPQAMTESTKMAEALVPMRTARKPCSPVGWAPECAQGAELVGKAGIPTFDYPEPRHASSPTCGRARTTCGHLREHPRWPKPSAPDRQREEMIQPCANRVAPSSPKSNEAIAGGLCLRS